MRLSCNGCRILRKGCSDNCNIRPCLQQWIKSPESQANATVFHAKFYGRAGLMNLINTGPQHLRPAIFRSLLYEACGRIVNPIYGSVGLLWSGSWHVCQNAVETVLQGSPITQIASDTAVLQGSPVTQIASDTAVLQGSPITQIASDTAVLQGTPITQIPFVRGQPLKAYDIRHNSKDDENSAGSAGVHRVRTRGRFKRSGAKGKVSRGWIGSMKKVSGQCENSKRVNSSIDLSSHESALSHQSEVVEESLASVKTSPAKTQTKLDGKVELELTLGHEPVERGKGKEEIGGVVLDNSVACAAAAAGLDLRLDCPV